MVYLYTLSWAVISKMHSISTFDLLLFKSFKVLRVKSEKKANSILSKYVPNYIMTEANTISAKVYLFFMFSIIFKYNLFDYK